MDKRLVALALGCFVAITTTAHAASLPALPVPTVQAPSLPDVPDLPVPVPTVVAPPLPVPVPTVVAPLPEVPLPVPTIVAAPAPSGSSPSAARPPAAAAPTSQRAAPAPTSQRAAPRWTASPSSAPAAGTSRGGGAAVSASRHGSSASRHGSGARSRGGQRAVARERRLRRIVRRLHGCLPELPRFEARVLRLRAGVGRGGPRSVATVARIVDRSERRVIRAERRGLRRLRHAARDGCGGTRPATAPGTALPDGTGAEAAPVLADAPAVPAAANPSSGSPASGGVLGARAESDGPTLDRAKRVPVAGGIHGPPLPHDASLTLPLLMALLGAGWLLARYLHRRAPEEGGPSPFR